MSESITLARPYARAVFAIARERSRLPQWSSMLGFAAQAVAEPSVQALLGDPRLDAQVLAGVLAPTGEADADFTQFLAVLADNGRLALLPEISGLYDAQRAEAEHVVKARITSASPLVASELATLTAAGQIVTTTAANGQTAAVDAALIGGAVIDAGDVVIDGSLRTKLARLGAALAN